MKFLKILAVLMIMFSAASQIYADETGENPDAPCTAVTTANGVDDAPIIVPTTATEDAQTGEQ
jgi:pyocin large subunit-like protein